MRKTICFTLVCIATLVLLAGAVGANSISYGPLTAIADSRTDWTRTLQFPQFNPATGTLTSVDLSITGEIKTTLTVTNDASSPSQGDARTHATITVKDPLNLLSVMPDIYSSPYGYSLAPGASISSGVLTNSTTDAGSWTASPILNQFIGIGNIDMSAVTLTETVLANTGGNTFASQWTYANATGLVTYNYTAVPEPSGIMALLTGAAGLLGMGMKRRRA